MEADHTSIYKSINMVLASTGDFANAFPEHVFKGIITRFVT
jgi:hypothetical protein